VKFNGFQEATDYEPDQSYNEFSLLKFVSFLFFFKFFFFSGRSGINTSSPKK
jgi:hypothetical protein